MESTAKVASEVTLRDYGERRIISEIISPLVAAIGDDCATTPLSGQPLELISTIDPVPTPAALAIAGVRDPYYKGWLSVIINASDLAASGADPVAFLVSIETRPDTLVEELRRFLCGVLDACQKEGLRFSGGNLKESDAFLNATGVALGIVEEGRSIKRKPIAPGDVIISVGRGGIFWYHALGLMEGRLTTPPDDSPLMTPLSQGKTMRRLRAGNLVRAAIENSDGLLPSLEQLAALNGVQIILSLDRLAEATPSEIARMMDEPERLWLGWGDWNVIAAVSEQDMDAIHEIAETPEEIFVIGTCTDGTTGTYLERDGRISPAARLESERFAADSWFTSGIEDYGRKLLEVKLP